MARPRKQTYTLDMYLRKIQSGDICNDADVQRSFVWNNEQINELIVTVLNDDYIPPVILGEEDNSQLHIADGGCRTAALNKFRNNAHKITAAIEDSVIPYKAKNKDESGNIIWVDTSFDIKNKTYEMLPEELRKRFDEYQIETVIHEHCDRHRISEYVKRYNRHTPMNNNQKAFTYIDNYAGQIREIVGSRFFLDYSDFNESEKAKGVMERVVVETVMCMNHMDDWKKQTKAICNFLNKNASEEEFAHFGDNLHRLEKIITDDIKDIFNSKDSFVFLTLFDRFIQLGTADIAFAKFLKEFKDTLRKTKRNRTGMLFDEIDKAKGTKDKAVILEKLDMLETLMKDYLHLAERPEDEEAFIADVVNMDPSEVHENMDIYNEDLSGSGTLRGLKDTCIRAGSKLLEEQNHLSLLAMVAYAYKMEQDLDEWMTDYASRNNTYFADQRKNFHHMQDDFNKYMFTEG